MRLHDTCHRLPRHRAPLPRPNRDTCHKNTRRCMTRATRMHAHATPPRAPCRPPPCAHSPRQTQTRVRVSPACAGGCQPSPPVCDVSACVDACSRSVSRCHRVAILCVLCRVAVCYYVCCATTCTTCTTHAMGIRPEVTETRLLWVWRDVTSSL
jgi:hypothetical protein